MKLIVGLGNPGAEYEASRHNLGFMVVDALIRRFRFGERVHEKDAYTRKGRIAGKPVMIAKPQTFMNRSGLAVASLVRANLESLDDLIVIYDDVDLELGRIRIRPSGSAGTHNGMRSILEEVASGQFPRIRLGVGGEGIGEQNLADYVLGNFEQDEMARVDRMIDDAVGALVLLARDDIRRAMNEFNKERKEETAGECE